MTDIEFQVEVQHRRPNAIIQSVGPTIVLEDDYDYPFIIAAVPLRGRRGFTGDKGDKGDTGDPGAPGAPGEPPELFSEILDGTQDGVNLDYELTHPAVPYSLMVVRNGLCEVAGVGYTLAGASLQFTTPPLATDLITLTYYIQR